MNFKSKTVLITGSNRGIGLALAKRFANEHCHLILTMRKAQPLLQKQLLSAGAQSVQIFELDLLQPVKIEEFLVETKKLSVDVLVNNAGLLCGGLLEQQNMSEIYQMMQVNLLALIHLTHGLLPTLLTRPEALIINNASVSGIMHFPCATTYSASKSAVLAFTESLKSELVGTSIKTLLMITSGVKTRMFDEIPKLYGDHLDLSITSGFITAEKWADCVVRAAIKDLEVVYPPHALTHLSLATAKHFPKIFNRFISQKFTRLKLP